MNHSTELLQILTDITGSPEVRKNPQLLLYKTEVLDSMRTVELFLAIEERWGVSISPADFDRETWATPEKFIQDVEARIATGA